jgi:hypothetical protein
MLTSILFLLAYIYSALVLPPGLFLSGTLGVGSSTLLTIGDVYTPSVAAGSYSVFFESNIKYDIRHVSLLGATPVESPIFNNSSNLSLNFTIFDNTDFFNTLSFGQLSLDSDFLSVPLVGPVFDVAFYSAPRCR